jgi:hypothetical protein
LNRRGGKVHRLLAGAAQSVDGRGRNCVRPSSGENTGATDTPTLLPGLSDAPNEHVLDERWVYSMTSGDLIEWKREKVNRMHLRESSLSARSWGSNCVNNKCRGHTFYLVNAP